ncbi:MAG: hypothetical protein OEV91_02980 [Desulfobulbaceae bacterium]|nr:hypothetical protein [Desulfobulbaceae bacterium]
MIRFDVPLLPDDRYVSFLAERAERLHSLHFRLAGDERLDGRHGGEGGDEQRLLASLRRVEGPRKYALLNSRFLHPDRYFDQGFLAGLAGQLVRLLDANQLTGVVFADFYLLRALADHAPDLCGRLEAVPGINCLVDSLEGIVAWRGYIGGAGFRPPEKIVLDRHLNRAPERLAALAARCRELFPSLSLTLIANEGCLDRCPFKLPHDAHIALANSGLAPERCGGMNDALGCRRSLSAQPEQLFRSPFIRPEDVARYQGLAAVIKICGRTLGPGFLETTVAAYLAGRFAGNLLALTDAMSWLADHLVVENQRLPGDFFDRLTSCAKECGRCRYCHTLFADCGSPAPIRLKDWRRQGTLL